MKIHKVIVSEYKTNCYILYLNNDCLVIDPGDDYEKIEKHIINYNVLGAITTHSHNDHIGASDKFESVYNYSNLKEGKNSIGPFEFEIIYTPGHCYDGITIYFEKDKAMFTGDFLFFETIGRTDLPGSNPEDMKKSIEKIKQYPNCDVYPGHGWSTTLEHEKENNPYF